MLACTGNPVHCVGGQEIDSPMAMLRIYTLCIRAMANTDMASVAQALGAGYANLVALHSTVCSGRCRCRRSIEHLGARRSGTRPPRRLRCRPRRQRDSGLSRARRWLRRRAGNGERRLEFVRQFSGKGLQVIGVFVHRPEQPGVVARKLAKLIPMGLESRPANELDVAGFHHIR